MALKVNGCIVVDDGRNVNAGITTTTTLNVPGTATAGTGCITGTITAGNATVPGTVTTGTGCVTGTMTAGTGCVTGTLTAATGCVPGTMTAGTATVPGTLTGGIVCATSCFSGSGSGLSNIPSGAITGGISAADICTFTSSGTWTKPTTAKFVMAEVIGAGGGGGGGSRSPGGTGCINAGGGGGGAGGYFSRVFPAPSLSPTVSITVGSGGVGGIPVQQPWSPTSPCPASYGHGTNGGNSSFGCYLIVSGGNGGLAPWPGAPTGAGGMGGGIGGRACPFFSPPVTAEMPSTSGSICCIQSTFRGISPPTNLCSGMECFGVYAGGAGGSSTECTTTRTLGAGNGVHSFIAGGGGGGGAGKYSPYGSPSTCPVIGGGGGLSNSYCSYQCGGPSIACIKGGDSATHSLNGCPAPSLYPADCMHGGGGGGTGSVGGAGGNASPIAGGGGGAGWNAPESCPGGNGGNGKVVVYSWS